MSGWLIDTNVLSELRRTKPEAKVVAFVAAEPLDRLYVSSVSFVEIRFGIERLADPARRAGRRSGYTFSQPDLVIAPAPLDHGLTVVSRDASDYRRARVPQSVDRRRAAVTRRRGLDL